MDNLLHRELLDAFDRETFEQEGYWVWEGVLTDPARVAWSKSLQSVQALNDALVTGTDWAGIDYARRGLEAPPADRITPQSLAACCGGSEQMAFQPPGLRDFMYTQGLFDPCIGDIGAPWQGMMPEYFPLAYDDFLLDVTTTHPQMMELLGKLLGNRFLIDHVLTLNRPPGSRGRRWHGHPYRNKRQHEMEDRIGSHRSLSKSFFPHQCVRTLCYPDGMSGSDGGGELAVVPGAHLYRIPYLWDTTRTEYDEEFEQAWLADKVHAFTGQSLRIQRLSLPPGSMVSFVHHMPHHVGHRDADAPTRWGLLMAYRTPDPDESPARWNEGTPAHWADRMERSGRLTTAMRRIFEGDNPGRRG